MFLDIELGAINGLEASQIILAECSKANIVFITAYSEYAVDAFELNAVDYLLKPVQIIRLSITLERIRININENSESEYESNSLKINCFGDFEVKNQNNQSISWRTKKSKEIFAYLYLNAGNIISKSNIIDEIFPDKEVDKAYTLLNTNIYKLRKNIEKLGFENSISFLNDCYKLELPIRSDVDDLEEYLSMNNHNDMSINKILELYKGELLEKEGYIWSINIQENYKNKVFEILYNYANEKINYKTTSSILNPVLDKLYKVDSLNVDIARLFIEYYAIQ